MKKKKLLCAKRKRKPGLEDQPCQIELSKFMHCLSGKQRKQKKT